MLDYLRRSGRLVGKHSEDMLSRVREDAEFFGLAGLVTAIDSHAEAIEAERTRAEEAADAKRLAETVATEERQAAREAELRRRKVVEYRHMLYGPLMVQPDTDHDTNEKRWAKLNTTSATLQNLNAAGWLVDKMSCDAEGVWLDLLLSRETGAVVGN